MPAWLAILGPLIQVQLLPSNFQRSLSTSRFPVESTPNPPKIQRCPALSIHFAAPERAPGKLLGDAVPFVPYTPGCRTTSAPPTQVQLVPSNLQRSFSTPEAPVESIPPPPNSQRFPLLSVHVTEPERAPG